MDLFKGSVTPKTDRFLRPLLVTFAVVAVLVELSAQIAQRGRMIGDIAESVLILLSLVLWAITALVILSMAKNNERMKGLLMVGVVLLLTSQVLGLCDEISEFNEVPLLGRSSPWNNPVESALSVLGLGLILIGLYFSLVRVNEAKETLQRDREELAHEVKRREEIEESLRRSEKRYRGLFDKANDIVYTLDAAGNITSVNRMGANLTGYTVEEILRMNVADIVVPEQLGLVREMIRGRIASTAPDRYEVEVVAKDGRKIPLEISTRLMVEKGETLGIHGIARDITERREAERAQKESANELRTLFEANPAAVFLETLDGKILDCNEAAVKTFGYTKQELLRLSVSDLVPEEVFKSFPKLVEDVARRNGSFVESVNVRKNGEVFPVEVSIKPVEIRGERLLYIVIGDISARVRAQEDRRKLEARIRQTQKMESLGVLAGGIAHDFNNLLMGVLGNASVALRELAPTSPARDSMEQIETAALRAADLAKQMLAYSGKGRFVLESIGLSDLVEEMAHLLEASISKGSILKYNFAPNLPAVEGDATQLRQVVMNLITNAAEAIGDKSGVITVCTGVSDCDASYLKTSYLDEDLPGGLYVFLEVTDTGCGMDKETASKIFDPFFTTKFSGRGLGLSAILGIIRGHKGAIRVYSEVGRGTTMKVLLPASGKLVAGAAQQDRADRGIRFEGTVLLVDDEETVRAVSKEMLENCGLEVLTARDGREGVHLFRENSDRISLVLLDMTMPHMGGEEAFQEIRRIRDDARIILSSGYNEREVTDRFAGRGFAGFIQKPYRVSTLVEKLSEVLRG